MMFSIAYEHIVAKILHKIANLDINGQIYKNNRNNKLHISRITIKKIKPIKR